MYSTMHYKSRAQPMVTNPACLPSYMSQQQMCFKSLHFSSSSQSPAWRGISRLKWTATARWRWWTGRPATELCSMKSWQRQRRATTSPVRPTAPTVNWRVCCVDSATLSPSEPRGTPAAASAGWRRKCSLVIENIRLKFEYLLLKAIYFSIIESFCIKVMSVL